LLSAVSFCPLEASMCGVAARFPRPLGLIPSAKRSPLPFYSLAVFSSVPKSDLAEFDWDPGNARSRLDLLSCPFAPPLRVVQLCGERLIFFGWVVGRAFFGGLCCHAPRRLTRDVPASGLLIRPRAFFWIVVLGRCTSVIRPMPSIPCVDQSSSAHPR